MNPLARHLSLSARIRSALPPQIYYYNRPLRSATLQLPLPTQPQQSTQSDWFGRLVLYWSFIGRKWKAVSQVHAMASELIKFFDLSFQPFVIVREAYCYLFASAWSMFLSYCCAWVSVNIASSLLLIFQQRCAIDAPEFFADFYAASVMAMALVDSTRILSSILMFFPWLREGLFLAATGR